MNKSLLIVFGIALYSCNEESSQVVSNNDSMAIKIINVKMISKDTLEHLPKLDSTNYSTNKINENILGVWGSGDEPNAIFEIKRNKIFYTEKSKSYKYKIIGDSIKIVYDDEEGSFGIKMRGIDTLILSNGEEQIYYRFKK